MTRTASPTSHLPRSSTRPISSDRPREQTLEALHEPSPAGRDVRDGRCPRPSCHARDPTLLRRRLPDRPALPARPRRDRRRGSAPAGDDRPRGRRLRAVLRRQARRLPRVRPRRPDLRDRRGAARPAGRADPQRAHRPLRRQGAGAGRLHPDRHVPRSRRPQWPGRGLQHDLPDRPRRAAEPVPQGQPVAPLGGPRQPARPARLRRAAVPGGRDRDRPARRGDLLRLALPRGDPRAGARRARRC